MPTNSCTRAYHTIFLFSYSQVIHVCSHFSVNFLFSDTRKHTRRISAVYTTTMMIIEWLEHKKTPNAFTAKMAQNVFLFAVFRVFFLFHKSGYFLKKKWIKVKNTHTLANTCIFQEALYWFLTHAIIDGKCPLTHHIFGREKKSPGFHDSAWWGFTQRSTPWKHNEKGTGSRVVCRVRNLMF